MTQPVELHWGSAGCSSFESVNSNQKGAKMRLYTAMMMTGLLTMVGCGGGGGEVDPNRPITVEVTGKVMYKDAPVEGASVTFRAEDKDGNGASAITTADGSFSLTTFAAGDGAVPGKYKVGIIKSEIVGADNSYSDVNSPNYGKEPPEAAKGKTVHHVPAKFNDPATSGLTAEVKSEATELEAFTLTD